jgi:DNA (cytosine-5)-methyltransferase 1
MSGRKYRVVDLFAGAGGFSLGFKRFNVDGIHPFDIIAAVEIDKNAVSTLISAMMREGLSREDVSNRVIDGDITESATKQRLYDLCRGRADVIIGGPPCQSFSTIGPRSGDREKRERFLNDDRDNLYEHYLEIVRVLRPKFFVFENVLGITTKKNGQGTFIDLIAERFEKLGYMLGNENVGVMRKYLILDAADYGVPQHRERVFIIGNRCGVKNPYPQRTHCPPELADDMGLLPYVTLKDAIGDLPRVIPKLTLTQPEKGKPIRDIPPEKRLQIEKRNRRRNNGTDPTEFHWDRFNQSFEEGNESRKLFLTYVKPGKADVMLTGHIARGQQESDIILFRGMRQGMSSKQLFVSDDPRVRELASLIKYSMGSFEDKYKKLSWKKPCGTLFAHLQKDGNRFIHPDSSQARTLTVREAARIQSFPDDYIFEATGNVRYKYIGNAVSPILADSIARAICQALSFMKRGGPEVRISKQSIVFNRMARRLLQAESIELAYDSDNKTIRIKKSEDGIRIEKTRVPARGFLEHFNIQERGRCRANYSDTEDVLYVRLK